MHALIESIVSVTLLYFIITADTKTDTTIHNLNVQTIFKVINLDTSNTASSKPLLISNISKLFDSNDWIQIFLNSAKDLLVNDKLTKQLQNITPQFGQISSQSMLKTIEQFCNGDHTLNNS